MAFNPGLRMRKISWMSTGEATEAINRACTCKETNINQTVRKNRAAAVAAAALIAVPDLTHCFERTHLGTAQFGTQNFNQLRSRHGSQFEIRNVALTHASHSTTAQGGHRVQKANVRPQGATELGCG